MAKVERRLSCAAKLAMLFVTVASCLAFATLVATVLATVSLFSSEATAAEVKVPADKTIDSVVNISFFIVTLQFVYYVDVTGKSMRVLAEMSWPCRKFYRGFYAD